MFNEKLHHTDHRGIRPRDNLPYPGACVHPSPLQNATNNTTRCASFIRTLFTLCDSWTNYLTNCRTSRHEFPKNLRLRVWRFNRRKNIRIYPYPSKFNLSWKYRAILFDKCSIQI